MIRRASQNEFKLKAHAVVSTIFYKNASKQAVRAGSLGFSLVICQTWNTWQVSFAKQNKTKHLHPCSRYKNALQKDHWDSAISTGWLCYLGKCYSNSQLPQLQHGGRHLEVEFKSAFTILTFTVRKVDSKHKKKQRKNLLKFFKPEQQKLTSVRALSKLAASLPIS